LLHGIPNKRASIAKTMRWTGITALLERASSALPAKLIVLTYHRIAEPSANPFYDPVISTTAESFHDQVEWLKRRFRLITLDELIAQLNAGSAWREPSLLVTFDDGYRDNFDVAVPILRKHNVPATFFIASEFLDTPSLPWWDYVAYVIKRTQISRMTLQRNHQATACPLRIDLTITSRSDAISTIVQAFLKNTIDDEVWFLDQLAKHAEVPVDSNQLGRALFMSWDQAQQLVQQYPGLTVGSHSRHHYQLAGLSHELQYRELTESQRVLEARLGYKISALAYPYGWPGTYTAYTKAIAAQVGYCIAFTASPGVNQSQDFDQYEVRRLGIGHTDSVSLLRARLALHSTMGWSPL
jgi:peptidoglycan/xylan/chitin deacetylase (PgdA/CDA1 family)